jgi:hypothetical protein
MIGVQKKLHIPNPTPTLENLTLTPLHPKWCTPQITNLFFILGTSMSIHVSKFPTKFGNCLKQQ